jgi:hypothetical protein
MLVSVDAFARRRPALSVAGAIAAGFVLSRLLTRPTHGESTREVGRH